MSTSRIITGAVVAALMFSAQAYGATITGTNAALSSPPANELYVPNSPGASGTLTTGGIGKVTDSVDVGPGGTSSGYVEFVLDFTGIGTAIVPAWAELQFTLRDIDFKPDLTDHGFGQDYTRTEAMEITMRSVANAQLGDTLVVNTANYGNYSPSGFAETDNATLDYLLSLQADLNLDAGDFTTLNNDLAFKTHLKFTNDLVNLSTWKTADIDNSTEDMTNSFGFEPVIPEPGTLAILACGGLGTLLRRRRRGK